MSVRVVRGSDAASLGARPLGKMRGELRSDDLADAYERARSRGRAHGVAEAAAALDGVLKDQRRTLAGSEEQLASLAIELAGHLVGYELTHQPAAFPRLVRRALDLAIGHGRVTLRVHPSDWGTLADVMTSLDDGHVEAVEWVADPSVAPKSARVDTKHGRIDCDLTLQLDALADRMGIERWRGAPVVNDRDPSEDSE